MTNFTDSTYNEVITLRKQVDSLFNLVETLTRVIDFQGNRLQELETYVGKDGEPMDEVVDAAQEAMIAEDYARMWNDIIEDHYPELKTKAGFSMEHFNRNKSEVQDD
jgi:hypothetical protein